MTSTLNQWGVGIIKPYAQTNLCTNPSIELTTTGYTAIASTLTVSATQSYWGQNSLKAAIGAGDANNAAGWYYEQAMVSGTTYYFSCWVYGASGKTYTIKITDAAGNVKSSSQFTGNGYWQRKSTYWACDSNATYRCTVIRDASQNDTTAFYCDGIQVETTKLTTYIDGTMDYFSNLKNVTEYYWTGAPHASTSVRIGDTRSGGEEILLGTYCKVLAILGMGLTAFNTIGVPKTLGGGIYQWSRPNTRALSIPVMFSGTNPGEVAADVKEIQNAVDPTTYPFDQPLRLYFHPLASDGVTEAGETCYVDAVYTGGLESVSWQAPTTGQAVLQFVAYMPVIMKQGYQKTALNWQTALGGNTMLRINMDTGVIDQPADTSYSGIGYQSARVFADDGAGNLYFGGDFVNAGDGGGDFLARFNMATSTLTSVKGGLTGVVNALEFDNAGNLFVGGNFQNVDIGSGADPDADNLLKWDGSVYNKLHASPPTGAVNDLAWTRAGQLYVAYSGTAAGGTAAQYLARWDGTAYNAVVSGTALNAAAYTVIVDYQWDNPDGAIVGGAFTDVGGVTSLDYLARVRVTGSTYTYEAIGVSPDGPVYAVTYEALTGRLYAFGDFENIGGLPIAHAAYWDGDSWYPMGDGLDDFSKYPSKVSTGRDGVVYAANNFASSGDIVMPDGIGYFSGNTWKAFKVNVATANRLGYATYYNHIYNTLFIGATMPDSEAYVEGYTTVTNSGWGPVFPMISITGPGTIWGITNYTTGEVVNFNNLTLATGETAYIYFDASGMPYTKNYTTLNGVRFRYLMPYVAEGSSQYIRLMVGANNFGLFIYGSTDTPTAAQIQYIQSYKSLENAGR